MFLCSINAHAEDLCSFFVPHTKDKKKSEVMMMGSWHSVDFGSFATLMMEQIHLNVNCPLSDSPITYLSGQGQKSDWENLLIWLNKFPVFNKKLKASISLLHSILICFVGAFTNAETGAPQDSDF